MTAMYTEERVSALNERFAGSSPENLLRWAIGEFFPDIALASSFGLEDVALIDMVWRINPMVEVFTLDTGRLNEETYEVMEKIRDRYGIRIVSYFPDREATERLEKEDGFYSFRKSVDARKLCCHIRKVEPLGRALKSLKAWITGLRREQAVTRGSAQMVEIDQGHHGMIKLSPLVDWTEADVRAYVGAKEIPYNALHNQGYPSIGCAPCTRAIKAGEHVRAGRWWWENPETKECGLHPAKAAP